TRFRRQGRRDPGSLTPYLSSHNRSRLLIRVPEPLTSSFGNFFHAPTRGLGRQPRMLLNRLLARHPLAMQG
ncbi:MAG: hypothetical protein M3N47_13555, partial [Chloroflexota bacterium]|nr:hypothetical protein [Chloroflexota bacterium]